MVFIVLILEHLAALAREVMRFRTTVAEPHANKPPGQPDCLRLW
jgi:hypothetical protein